MPASGLRGASMSFRSPASWRWSTSTFGALTNLSYVVINDMVLKGGGAILNVASTAAFQPGPEHGGLFRDQGLCAVVHRGAARGMEGARHPRHRAVPGADQDRVRRGRRLWRTRRVRSLRGGFGERRARRPRRSRQEPGGGHSGPRSTRSVLPRRGSFRGRWFARSPERSNIEKRARAPIELNGAAAVTLAA